MNTIIETIGLIIQIYCLLIRRALFSFCISCDSAFECETYLYYNMNKDNLTKQSMENIFSSHYFNMYQYSLVVCRMQR